MIFWIASYPKSGNTWIRTLLSAYYFSSDGVFQENLIKNIGQFPEKRHFKDFNYDQKIVTDTTKLWVRAQEKINLEKKLIFFKTHNAFGNVNGNSFTDQNNSVGAVYIVRDPRNVITSLKNHYELDDNKAYSWMCNEKNYLYDVDNFAEDGYSDFQFIGSWSTNYKSWKIQKKIPIKIIKYEDLLNQTYFVIKDLLEFINSLTKNESKVNKEKLKKAVNSTLFEKLKDNEEKEGFSEAVMSKKEKKKISFFNLGPKNDWTKILDKNLTEKIEQAFEESMKDLNYI